MKVKDTFNYRMDFFNIDRLEVVINGNKRVNLYDSKQGFKTWHQIRDLLIEKFGEWRFVGFSFYSRDDSLSILIGE